MSHSLPIIKIISGGQTGADRAALDWAMSRGFEAGGWCPEGRLAEDGRIPEKYPVSELVGAGYRKRNRLNVESSDATLILNLGILDGGTLQTKLFAEQLKKPWLLLQLDDGVDMQARANALTSWLRDTRTRILNIAGPRESKRPGIHAQSIALLDTTSPLE